MKTIGLIGGMSWESTVTYYQIINRTVQEQLGGLHSAQCVLWSVDFQGIEACQARGAWSESANILGRAAQGLEKAGADFFLICTNTMHKVADEVQAFVSIPLLHIADLTAERLQADGITRVGLLGTKYTMEDTFYRERLERRGLEVMVPAAAERQRLNDVIFKELCLGTIDAGSKAFVLAEIAALAAAGAQGVILGCTEIGLLVTQEDTPCPLFDTALIHARGAALHALA